MAKDQAYQMRESSTAELLKKVSTLKGELMHARIQNATKGQQQGKTGAIRTIRKSIARALTVYNEKRREEAKKAFAGKKHLPREMRPKLTRALRQAMTKEQKTLKVSRVAKKEANFPLRKFAVLA